MFRSLSILPRRRRDVNAVRRALAEPAAGQDSNGMHRRHLALLGSRTGEARASVGTAPSNRHIRGMTWRRSLCGSDCPGSRTSRSVCGSGCRSGPSVNRSAGQDAATRSRLQDTAPLRLPQNLLATFLLIAMVGGMLAFRQLGCRGVPNDRLRSSSALRRICDGCRPMACRVRSPGVSRTTREGSRGADTRAPLSLRRESCLI